jgi:citrate synthase
MTTDISEGGGTLHVTDSRTGRSYDIPVTDGAIRAVDLRDIKVSEDDAGLLSYDPAFMNTASCRSAITFIDGDKGILRYRGYPIEELAENASFLQVAYLLLHGDLPSEDEAAAWVGEITNHTFVHENIKKSIDGFHHDAHPMGILVGTLGALSTFYPEAKAIFDEEHRRKQAVRLIAKTPTLAAFAYRHAVGLPYAYPDDELSYAGNFLNMMWKTTELTYRPDPVLEHALDVLFTLHADHEQNCSANVMRAVGSAHADPYSAAAAAAAALYGPLHGGANEQVLRMLDEIALDDEYFVTRKLYPNVDFYSGIIYQAMGFPTDMFPVLFAIGRTPGWLAQWQEGIDDPEQKISRPRQLYVGEHLRHLEPQVHPA